MKNLDPYHDISIPVYIINTTEHPDDFVTIRNEFIGKDEFEITLIEAYKHPIVAVGLWKSITHIIEMAIENEDDVIIIGKEDHRFTKEYNKELLFKNLFEAAEYGVNLLVGGVSSFGQAIPINENLYWIDSFSNSRFMIIFRIFYQKILDETFELHDTVDGKLSELTSHKMLINPFISKGRNLSYRFTLAALRLEMLKQAQLRHVGSDENTSDQLKSAMINYNKRNTDHIELAAERIKTLACFVKIPKTVMSLPETKIIVLVPFYNVTDYIMECYQSLIEQDYQNFEILFIDDCSSDGCIDLIPENKKVFKVKMQERSLALANLYSVLKSYSFNDEDIVIIVDGDDFLWHNQIFAELNEIYNKRKCLVTYGQYRSLDNRIGHCKPYTENDFQNLRALDWRASHLKTFKYKIYKEFLDLDPNVNSYKDDKGSFYKMTYGIALMTPLLEIAGFENVYFNDRPWYIYREHKKNNVIIDASLQFHVAKEIKKKIPFKRSYEQIDKL